MRISDWSSDVCSSDLSEPLKACPGGMLFLCGANSAASLSSMPIRFFLGDEIDRFPWEVGGEGDPIMLIDERQKTFVRRKRLLISSPTIKGQSRIELECLASDQRRLLLPCPHCDTYIELLWQPPDGVTGLEERRSGEGGGGKGGCRMGGYR